MTRREGADPRRGADVLMITHRRAGAVRLSLPPLLASMSEHDRVWLWHNGDDEETLETVRGFLDDDRVGRFHHSRDNVRLVPPTHWLWQESQARYVSKVDDDCIELPSWLDTLRSAHEDNPQLGVIGSWRQYPDEYRHDLVQRKVRRLAGGHRIMENLWVQGSGYLVTRDDVAMTGALPPNGSFAHWCLRLAGHGRTNGFYFPFIFEDHMDDPRSPNTLLRSDEDLLNAPPLSAVRTDVRSLAEWSAKREAEAIQLQTASVHLRDHTGWRKRRRSAGLRLRNLVTGRRTEW